MHLLDWVCGMVKQVVRSTFTSEGHGVLATMDQALVLAVTLHEIERGPLHMSRLRDITDKGDMCYHVDVVTDAKNLLMALEVARMKPPAEKNLLLSSVVDAVEARDR